ncbi:hypothetical protein [Chitinimonas sp. BJB300]|nr:hypothetical protein [Chitinimonas sp. BJB300]
MQELNKQEAETVNGGISGAVAIFGVLYAYIVGALIKSQRS